MSHRGEESLIADVFLGIEIGGTKLQAALGDGAGTIFQSRRIAAEPKAGRQGICRQIEQLTSELVGQTDSASRPIAACGIGFGGPVDSNRGCVLKSHQVSGWDDFPIVDWFVQRFKVPTALGNDSDMAGWAEALYGAGKGLSPVVYMNIGSGIGGAFIVNGRLYDGQGLGAAEIGHLRMVPAESGQPWHTLESLCSGWAMAGQAREILGTASLEISAQLLFDAADSGDPAARQARDLAIERLGVAIANVITLLHPKRVVLGGGVSLLGPRLLDPLRREVEKQVFAPFSRSYEIVPAALGEDVVLHGALCLARSLGLDSHKGFPDSHGLAGP